MLIYATGFEFMSREAMARVVGSDGRSIADKWETEGTRTFVGMHTHGFPNLYIVAGPQGTGGSFNFLDAIEEHAAYFVDLLTAMRDHGHGVVDVLVEHEDSFTEHCIAADLMSKPLRDCVGNFNGYGRAAPGSLGYFGGREAGRLRAWALETLEPFEFRPAR